MFKSHSTRYSLVWLQSNHLGQKIHSELVHMFYMLAHWYSSPSRESRFKVIIFQSFWPIILIWSTLNRKDLENLVDFGVSDEKSSPLGHFCEDTADGPHVDWCRVLLCTEKNLRGSVPKGYDLVSIGLDWESEGSC